MILRVLYRLTFGVLLFLAACDQKFSDEHLLVGEEINENAGLSQIADQVVPVFLETTEKSMLKNITQVVTSDKYIFISEFKGGIFKFDRNGKFIDKIGTEGKGPGEYNYINSIALDCERENIFIASFNKVLQYDFEGVFIKEIIADDIVQALGYYKDHVYYIGTAYEEIQKARLYTLNRSLSLIETKEIWSVNPKKTIGSIPPAGMVYLNRNGGELTVYYPILIPYKPKHSTLFSLNGAKLDTIVSLDFGQEGINEDNFNIINIFQVGQAVFANYYFRSEEYFFVHNQESNSSIHLKKGFNDDFYQTGLVRIMPVNSSNEILFIKNGHELSGIFEDVNNFSNPALFFVDLKNSF